MHEYIVMDEIDEESRQGYQREPRCQAVDAINEVDGIVDEDDEENGQRNTDKVRYFVNAEQSVEIVHI